MYLLIIFIPLFLFYYRQKSVAILLTGLVLISLLGTLLLGRENEIEINNLWDVFSVFFPGLILFLMIIPWTKWKGVKEIRVVNKIKVRKLTRFLIGVNIFTFIVFSITAIIVQTTVKDIGQFKYTEGTALRFYATMLPFDMRFFILCTLIYGFSYFMIPLHFYYLSIKNYRLAIICFILSLNIILHGATFFSRAVLVEYSLLYLAIYWLLHQSISEKVKKIFKYILILPLFIVLVNMFLGITGDRFKNTSYFDKYIQNSPIKNPELYSLFDYTSQWYFNSFSVSKDYDYTTFGGKVTFESVNNILGRYGVISYNPDELLKERKMLWKENWFTFTGLTAYSLYDYGIFLTILLSLLYKGYVQKRAPKSGIVLLNDLFIVVLIIQLPLMSIFYSSAGGLIIPLIFCFFIRKYLKVKVQ